MRKILVSLSIIGIVGAIAIGGTVAYFSDVETSTGNTFSAGTLDLKLWCPPRLIPGSIDLNPNSGYDTTSKPYYTLTSADLAKLKSSDDVRYESDGFWAATFGEYIEFKFPAIPTEATITGVVLKFEWQRTEGTFNARLMVWEEGVGWRIHSLLPLPPATTDRTETIPLTYLDTADKVNALKIWFQATGGITRHDWVEVQVNYTLPGMPNWCDEDIGPTFTVKGIKPGDFSPAPARVKVKNVGSINGTLKIRANNIINYEMGCLEPEVESGDETCESEKGELSQYLRLSFSLDGGPKSTATIDELKIAGLPLGSLSAGQEKEVSISWNLPEGTGNIVQSDGVEFDIEFILEQS